jgi:hypothetical protein
VSITDTGLPQCVSFVWRYLTQLLGQPLSSYALVILPVKYWVMFNMTSWSIVTICTCR